MKNIEKLGSVPSLAKPIRGNVDPLANLNYGKIIDHALQRFLTHEEFLKVTTGYRRSPWSESALDTDLEKLDCDSFDVLKDCHYYAAIEHTRKLFQPKALLRPVHFADLRLYPWKLSTSVGAPFATSKEWNQYVNEKFDKGFTKPYYRDLFAEAHGESLLPTMIDRRMTKRNLYNEMFFINRKNIHMIKDGKTTNEHGHDLRYWNTAFARQHLVLAEDEDKVRLVFGAPSTLLMAELTFIWPLQASLLDRGEESPLLWGYETTTGGWSRIYRWAHAVMPRYNFVATLDWKRFDREARHTVISDIHSLIMRPLFDFSHGYHPTIYYPDSSEADPTRIENLWNWMTNATLTTPLMLPNGDLLKFNHSGIYSGYFQTQILDSMYNCVMIFTILSKMGFDLEKVAIKVQGDDSIFLMPHDFNYLKGSFLQFFSYYARTYFGSTLNMEKSEILPSLEGAEILKYRNHGTMPYRDELQLLAMLRHPERTVSLSALMARSIGIAYANCGNSTRVYHICEDIYNFLLKGGYSPDPHGLPGGLRYRQDYVPSSAEVDISHFPTYHETVRLLQEPSRPLLTEQHWPVQHFLGVPGKS
nr:putative RNA-dependent RNA polymerase [Poaceae Liege partitivirus 6]